MEDYEKLYKNAVKRIQTTYQDDFGCVHVKPEEIFPELKESEDERIMKAIKEAVEHYWLDDTQARTDVFAWLEKQGEHPFEYDEKYIADIFEQVGLAKIARKLANDDLTNALQYAMIELSKKHYKQKPTDKVEPKFHKGDWIVDTRTDKILQIQSVDSNGYDCTNGDYFSNSASDNYRLWTIKDANDGDVLANGNMVLIFKRFEEPSYRQHIIAYIGLDAYGEIQVTNGSWNLGLDSAKPATKEQRELLFQKMKEAGYEWDEEKKELKKIEQKSFNDIKEALRTEYEKGRADAIAEMQKPAWSEENNCYYDDICEILINLIHSPKSNVNKDAVQKGLDWLMSVKESQLNSAWSDEDEEMFKSLKILLNEASCYSCTEGVDKILYWLKSLKERIV